MHHTRSSFGSLFDISFSSFVTPRIVKIIYILAIIAILISAITMIVQAFEISRDRGLFTLIIAAPLFFLLTLIYVRIVLEILIVIFRIEEHVASMAGREPASTAGWHEEEKRPVTKESESEPPPSI